jgi:hypothetical protein
MCRKLKAQLAIWYANIAKHPQGKKQAKKPKTKSSGGSAAALRSHHSCSAGAA